MAGVITQASVDEVRETLEDKYSVAAILKPYGRAGRWHMMTVYQATQYRSTHDSLADAKDEFMRELAMADEARWELDRTVCGICDGWGHSICPLEDRGYWDTYIEERETGIW